MREGSLEAPTRHPVNWQDPDFYDEVKLDAELRRPSFPHTFAENPVNLPPSALLTAPQPAVAPERPRQSASVEGLELGQLGLGLDAQETTP